MSKAIKVVTNNKTIEEIFREQDEQLFNSLMSSGQSPITEQKSDIRNLSNTDLIANTNIQQSDFTNENNVLYQSINNYLVPQEVYTDTNWGQKTAHKLNDYMQNYTSYPGRINTGILAPFKDMLRNYNDMKNINLIGADNFFHCKGNHEATQRGLLGEAIGKTISAVREVFGLLSGDSLADIRKDWHANRMGWNGAKQGLTLEESCPTNPKEYLDITDYKNIF